MKRFTLALALLAIVAAMPMAAQFEAYSDVPPGFEPPAMQPIAPGPAAPPTEAQTYYADRATFQAAAPPLSLEDFTGSLVPPAGVCADIAPLNETTNDVCFPAGGVIAGFEVDVMDAPPDDEYVIATTGFIGAPYDIVGPNTFTDNTILRFNPAVNAVGFDLVGILGTVNPAIDIYDEAGVLLASTSASAGAAGVFWGVVSDELIGRIELIEGAGGGELIGNLELGVLPNTPIIEVPTLGFAGLGMLLALLAGTGIFAMRRRR